MNKNMENIFDNVYKNRIWDITTNSISGKGSEPINCQNWNSLLNNIIKEKDIKSILDFGCGDAASIMDLNLDGIIYTGVDISVIPLNKAKEKYKNNNINFIHKTDNKIENEYDLCIIKHVFGHWLDRKDNGLKGLNCKANHKITDFLLENFDKFKYIIINDNIDDRISNFLPKNLEYKKIKFNSYGNKYNNLYFYDFNN